MHVGGVPEGDNGLGVCVFIGGAAVKPHQLFSMQLLKTVERAFGVESDNRRDHCSATGDMARCSRTTGMLAMWMSSTDPNKHTHSWRLRFCHPYPALTRPCPWHTQGATWEVNMDAPQHQQQNTLSRTTQNRSEPIRIPFGVHGTKKQTNRYLLEPLREGSTGEVQGFQGAEAVN